MHSTAWNHSWLERRFHLVFLSRESITGRRCDDRRSEAGGEVLTGFLRLAATVPGPPVIGFELHDSMAPGDWLRIVKPEIGFELQNLSGNPDLYPARICVYLRLNSPPLPFNELAGIRSQLF